MSYSERDYEVWKKNELKLEDTFRFECGMCGQCCRNRKEPIILTGADVFRISKSLGTSIEEVIAKNTIGYIGENSHAPVLVLKERLDGSCRLLRNGKCMVHQDKPVVCALYPLGRFFDMRDNSFHYFLNPYTCQFGESSGKVWTLREWLNEFKVEETEAMTAAWNRLVGGLAQVTCKMDRDKITGRLLDILIGALYMEYNLNAPYIQQVEKHMESTKRIFEKEFHKKVTFQ